MQVEKKMISWYWIPIAFVIGLLLWDLKGIAGALLSLVLYKIFD